MAIKRRTARAAHGAAVGETKAGGAGTARASYVVATVRRPAGDKSKSRDRRTQVPATEYAPRISNIVSVLGTQVALADILRVDRSRITRWAKGEESPGEEAARDLVDLDHLIARAKLVLHQSVIKDWLTSSNQFIPGSASPIDAVRTGHAEDAVHAIRAEAEGAYA